MNRELIRRTLLLEVAVQEALRADGCIHKFRVGDDVEQTPVPIDAAHFDPQSGLIWIKIHFQRFPRHYDPYRAMERDLAAEIGRRLQVPVVVVCREQHLVVITSGITGDARARRQELAPFVLKSVSSERVSM